MAGPDLLGDPLARAEFEAVPWPERYPASSSYDLLMRAAMQSPASPALSWLENPGAVSPSAIVSYGELARRVTSTANMLRTLGITADQALMTILPICPESYELLLGAMAAGVVVPVNAYLAPTSIRDIALKGHCRVIAIHDVDDSLALMKAILPDLPLVSAIISVKPSSRTAILGRKILHLGTEVGKTETEKLTFSAPDRNAIAALFHTGGTTGSPKLVPHRHRQHVFMAEISRELLDLGPDDCNLGGLPLFHVNALFASCLIPIAAGARIIQASPLGFRDPLMLQNLWRIVETCRVTNFSAVPTIFARLLDMGTPSADLSSLRFALCGAAPMTVGLFERFEKAVPVRIVEGYGLTESTVMATLNPPWHRREIGSVGLCIPYTKVRIMGPDGDVEAGDVGIVMLRGPNVVTHYFNGDFSLAAENPNDELDTGDLGSIDREGYVRLSGRAKDLIIRGGHNLDPQMIEAVLLGHDDVSEAAAIGQPDAKVGELPCAFVVLKPERCVDAQALIDFVQQHIADPAALPVHVEIVDALPLTAVGKIFKPALRARATERVLEARLKAAGLQSRVRAEVLSSGKLRCTLDPEINRELAGWIIQDYAVDWAVEATDGERKDVH
jgi:fatty-acyl-CoA synthase